MTLEDRIYCLQKTPGLTKQVRRWVYLADVHYLKDNDVLAEIYIDNAEYVCRRLGIEIYVPENYMAFG